MIQISMALILGNYFFKFNYVTSIFCYSIKTASSNFQSKPNKSLKEEDEIKSVRKNIGMITNLERTPIRVSNPIVNDEIFLRENTFFTRPTLKLAFFRERE